MDQLAEPTLFITKKEYVNNYPKWIDISPLTQYFSERNPSNVDNIWLVDPDCKDDMKQITKLATQWVRLSRELDNVTDYIGKLKQQRLMDLRDR
jgi:hypothetical protein